MLPSISLAVLTAKSKLAARSFAMASAADLDDANTAANFVSISSAALAKPIKLFAAATAAAPTSAMATDSIFAALIGAANPAFSFAFSFSDALPTFLNAPDVESLARTTMSMMFAIMSVRFRYGLAKPT